MTVICRTCGSQVSDDYARVLAPEALVAKCEVRCCPDCDAKIRRNGRVAEARAARHGTPESTRYDPEKATSSRSPETETGDTLRTDGGRIPACSNCGRELVPDSRDKWVCPACFDGASPARDHDTLRTDGGQCVDGIERYLVTGSCACVWYLRIEPNRAYLHSVLDEETNEIVPREHAYEIRDSARLEATSVTDTPIEHPGGPA